MTIGVDPQTHKATSIRLFSFGRPHMRVFHMSWMAFFLAFFGWFGIAPMMALVRDDLQLTKTEIGNTVIASVAVTIVARLVVGWLCDRIGPRITYSGLLIIGSIPVMTIGLANSYESFLLFRLAIGIIGASFVITQYHTSVMFAPNVVGTANATTAGWGNMGGGVTQMAMPLALGAIVALGATDVIGWRIAMVVPGITLFLMGIAYFKFTQDSPSEQVAKERANEPPGAGTRAFIEAAKDHRVWALFLIYGACFGVELTMNNIAALLLPRPLRTRRGAGGTDSRPVRRDEHLCPLAGRASSATRWVFALASEAGPCSWEQFCWWRVSPLRPSREWTFCP